MVNGTKVDNTSSDGYFQFKVPEGTRRVVITAKDSSFNKLLETTKVKELQEDSLGFYVIFIKMVPLGTSYELETSKDSVIDIGNGDVPFVQVIIPSNSFYTLSGEKFNKKAVVHVNVIDPRNITDVVNAPGDLSFTDQNGRQQRLQTFGMFSLYFKSTITGERLQIREKVRVVLSKEILPKNNSTIPRLWNLDSSDGFWQDEGAMMEGSTFKSFKSNKHSNKDLFYDDVMVGDITVDINKQWSNFDGYTEEACYSKIRTFATNDYDDKSQVPGVDVTVIVIEDMQGDEATGSSSMVRAWTDPNDANGYCVVHLCDTDLTPGEGNGKFKF